MSLAECSLLFNVVLLAAGSAFAAEGNDTPVNDQARWKDVTRFHFYVARCYLEGGPMLVAIELWNEGDGTCYLGGGKRRMPHLLGWGGSEPLSVIMTSPDGKRQYIAKGREPGPGGPHGGRESFPLPKGGRLRTLVDLTDLVLLDLADVTRRIPPEYRTFAPEFGIYSLTMCFHFHETGLIRFPDPDAALSEARRIRIDPATEVERNALQKVRGALRWPEQAETWYKAVTRPKESAAYVGLPPRVEEELKPYLFLRKTRHARNLADVGFEDLDALDKTYLAPEASVWRYELLLAKARKDEAEALRKKIEADHPGLLWRLKEVDDGRGYLSRFPIKD